MIAFDRVRWAVSRPAHINPSSLIHPHTCPQLTIYVGKVLLLIMKTDFWQFKLKKQTELGLRQKTAR